MWVTEEENRTEALKEIIEQVAYTLGSRVEDVRAREEYGYRYPGCRESLEYESDLRKLDKMIGEYISAHKERV